MRSAARHITAALGIVLGPAAIAAGAETDLNEVLFRARNGGSLSGPEREVAAHLLREWRESEEVAPGTGDPALGRALESMAVGRTLGPGEALALERYRETCRRSREEDAPSPGAAGLEGAPPPRRTLARICRGGVRRLKAYWFAPVAGVCVFGAGLAWILVRRTCGRSGP